MHDIPRLHIEHDFVRLEGGKFLDRALPESPYPPQTLRFIVEHNLVDCIVTSAGGIEEDLIKCLAPTYVGDFALKGADLRAKVQFRLWLDDRFLSLLQGHNRIGNLLVPNNNYCLFEDWLMPILDKVVAAKKGDKLYYNENWTPMKLVHTLGREVRCWLLFVRSHQLSYRSTTNRRYATGRTRTIYRSSVRH